MLSVMMGVVVEKRLVMRIDVEPMSGLLSGSGEIKIFFSLKYKKELLDAIALYKHLEL